MAQWCDFLPHVLPFAPGCPDPVAEFNLREAARDFCARTRAWRVTLPAITVTHAGGFGPYAMPLPADTELVRIERATMDGRFIDVVSVDALPADWQQYPGTVRDCVFTLDRLAVQAVPVYEAERALVLDVTLKPGDLADELPDELARLHMRTIADGALELICMQPEKPYTNLPLSLVKGQLFREKTAKASIQVQRGHSGFRPRARGKFF